MNLFKTSRDLNGHPHTLTIASWDRSAYSSALPPRGRTQDFLMGGGGEKKYV